MASYWNSEARRSRIIYLIVALLITYGLYGPMLLLFGESSVATLTSARSISGTRPEYQMRYVWTAGYEFTARNGRQYSGHTRALADDAGPTIAPRGRVVYLPAFPYLNMLAEDATPGTGHGLLFAIAALLMWWTAPQKSTKKGTRADQLSRLQKNRKVHKTQESDSKLGP